VTGSGGMTSLMTSNGLRKIGHDWNTVSLARHEYLGLIKPFYVPAPIRPISYN
jgi:hypothetical protein